MMKKVALGAILLSLGPALAYVPPGYQEPGQGGLPSVRPVRGPIRPNTASINQESETASPLLAHWPVGSAYYLTASVYWGADWGNSQFAGDKIVGMDRWYAGYTNSNYANILSVRGVLAYRGHVTDLTSEPPNGSQQNDVIPALGEICRLIYERRLPYVRSGSFYPVYLTKKRPAGGVCAINGTYDCFSNMTNPVSFTLIYNLDGDAACDPQDTETHHSQGLAAIANVSARAVADLMSDWDFEGLYDSSGNEVDDKCAWTFNVPYVTFTNGSRWKLQGLWSNLAYNKGTGYPNANGDKGCVDGH